jgi:hypothetical protein
MNATDAEKTDLVRVIKRSLFRPRLEDGRVTDASHVVVRCYLPAAGSDSDISDSELRGRDVRSDPTR